MPSYYWIKLYHEILEDPKMGQLPDRVWRRCIELFLLAGDVADEGTLPPVEDMAWRLRISEDALLEDLTALEAVGIVTRDGDAWTVTNFASRQGPVCDAERMARYRERQQTAEYYNDYEKTERNENSDGPVTNCNADTESDIDTNSDTESEHGASAPPTPPPKPDKLTAGQRGFLDVFGAKRYKLRIQRDTILELEQKYGTAALLEAARWAAKKGLSVGKAIVSVESALPKWGKPKQKPQREYKDYGTTPLEHAEPTPDEALWQGILVDLRGQMTEASYDSLLANSVPVARDDGALVVRVERPGASEWLHERLGRIVADTVARHEAGLRVEFVEGEKG